MIFNTGENCEELKAKYNPEGSILRKAQLRMLEMLVWLDKLCKEQGIEYCLEGGNVLGAIRHNGFIPWDDDVDIIMRRGEYKKLCDYLLKHPHPQFKLQSHKTDKGYFGSWNVLRDTKSEYIKDDPIHNLRTFRGLQIDIFPIEIGYSRIISKIAGNIHHWNNKYFVAKHNVIAHYYYLVEQKICFPVLRAISSLIGDKRYFTYELGHGHYPKFPVASTFPVSSIQFEGFTLLGPNNTSDYLTALFGNYMILPPPDKRNKHQANYRIWD